jgi:TonB family protein
MVFGSWSTIALDGSKQALTDAPSPFDIVVNDSEITISNLDDPYGPRTFGIVNARRVESWIEYELRGQGGSSADGKRTAVFVLSPPGAQARTERFVVPEADGTIAVGSQPPVVENEVHEERARRAVQDPLASTDTRRVTAADLMKKRAGSVEGTVVIEVVVDENGKVVEATAVSGPAILRSEALRAAGKWRFRPFVYGDTPSRVQGEISFRFSR